MLIVVAAVEAPSNTDMTLLVLIEIRRQRHTTECTAAVAFGNECPAPIGGSRGLNGSTGNNPWHDSDVEAH